MTKILYVGDYHARTNDLEECKALGDYIVKVFNEEKCSRVVFLGDQFHTHLTVNLEVMRFWFDLFGKLDGGRDPYMLHKVIALVGNHDKRVGTDIVDTHSMMPFGDTVLIVSRPTYIANGIAAMPHYTSHEDFVKAANELNGIETLICHQTFDGSKYENGFYAPDGIDSNLLKQGAIISGHIHAQQEVGKVWYPGSPRWLTLGDANEEKAIWVVTHDDNGRIVERTPYDTSTVCTRILLLEDTPEAPVEVPEGKALVTVDVRGPAEYIAQRKEELAAKGVTRIRTFPTRERKVIVRESDGISVAFQKYINGFKPRNGTDIESLFALVRERVSWMRN